MLCINKRLYWADRSDGCNRCHGCNGRCRCRRCDWRNGCYGRDRRNGCHGHSRDHRRRYRYDGNARF